MTAETAAGVLDAVRALAPKISARSEETEQRGSIAPDLFDDLVETGVLRSLVAARYGGLEMTLADVNDILVETARADGGVGWLTMIGIHGAFLVSMFPQSAVDGFFANGPDLRVRGAIAPKGMATPLEGGFMVNGQWPFASGGPDPQIVVGNCVVFDGSAPRIGPAGVPELVAVAMDAADVEFLDTWHALGFKGTDSCDFVAHDVFVPTHRTMNMFTATSCFDTPPARLPVRTVLAMGHGAVAAGIAQGALDDITALAVSKRAAMNPTARLAADPIFQHRLGQESLRLTAARSLLDHETVLLWAAGGARRSLTPIETLEARSTAGYVTAECVKVVDAAYTLAGSTSLYDTSSLQRRLRDIHVATQHVAATPESYRTLGALLAGEDVPPMALF